jgi:hypothetical protein
LRRQHAFYPDFFDEDDALILKAITWKCPNGPVNFECGSFHKADGATSAEFRKAHEFLIERFNEEWQMVRLLPLWTLTMQTRLNVVMTRASRGGCTQSTRPMCKCDELLQPPYPVVVCFRVAGLAVDVCDWCSLFHTQAHGWLWFCRAVLAVFLRGALSPSLVPCRVVNTRPLADVGLLSFLGHHLHCQQAQPIGGGVYLSNCLGSAHIFALAIALRRPIIVYSNAKAASVSCKSLICLSFARLQEADCGGMQ